MARARCARAVAALLLGLAAAEDHGSQLRGQVSPAAGVCGKLWPAALAQKGYSEHLYVGQGATACVYLASKDGVPVALKVSKEKGQANELAFQRVCSDMHLLRLKACKQDVEELLNLHETFLPNCLEAGEAGGFAYYAMHAAPTDVIEEVGNGIINFDVATAKAVFAQLVAATYALHAVGLAHNDLHGLNIVFDQKGKPPPLALIDLDEVEELKLAMKDTYKRDGNAVTRWAAVLASCPLEAQWPDNSELMKVAMPKFLDCLKGKWEVEEDFTQAIEDVAEANIAMAEEQHVTGLFKTKFVQENLPQLTPHFRWAGSQSCEMWDAAKFSEVEAQALFNGHWKCDSVPTFADDPDKACHLTETKAACFSTKPGVFWSCGSGLDRRVPCATVGLPEGGGTYDGPCLMKGHRGYPFAMTWGGGKVEPTTTTALPLPTTTTEAAGSNSASLLLLLKVVLVIAALALLWFLIKDKLVPPPQAREAAPGTEMNARQ